jgi:hypothetical protein
MMSSSPRTVLGSCVAVAAVVGLVATSRAEVSPTTPAPTTATTPTSTSPLQTTPVGTSPAVEFDDVPDGGLVGVRVPKSQGKKPDFDRVYYPRKKNVPVRLLGVTVARMPERNFGWFDNQAAVRGIENISVYRVVYKIDHDPARPAYAADAVAAITAAGAIFHDGYAWRGYLGPFSEYTLAFTRKCTTKWIFLANETEATEGTTLQLRFSFPRTRQRITARALVTAGDVRGESADQLKAATSIGCPVDQSVAHGYDVNAVGGGLTVSPASIAPTPSAHRP